MKGRLGFGSMLLSVCCEWPEAAVGLDMANMSYDMYEMSLFDSVQFSVCN